MSGIAAIIHTDGLPVDPLQLQAMTTAMDYRGPDGIGHWAERSVGLGHCALHTTAESMESEQPAQNHDGSLVIVMDGYLTNNQELRLELLARGARLRNHSDVELVLCAYELWHDKCPQQIDGEYAFVIWDGRRREVFCARDHQGLRPLLYHWDGETLVIASDIAAVLAALPDEPLPNRGFLAEIMTDQWYSADETVWQGIMRLLPAHSMKLCAKSLSFSEYWTLNPEITLVYKHDEDYFEHYRELLADCVRRASRTHRPLAFEVSGGLDSSALFCLAHKLQEGGQLRAPSIRGYTLASPGGTAADEIEYVHAIEEILDIQVEQVDLFLPQLEWFLRQSRQDRDVPTYPNGAMSIGLGEKLVADSCRVSINGSGGDQWLDGRTSYYRELMESADIRGFLESLAEDVTHHGLRRAVLTMLRMGPGSYLPRKVRWALGRSLGMIKQPSDKVPYWLTSALREELLRRKSGFERSLPENERWRYKWYKLRYPYYAHAFDLLSRQSSQLGFEARYPLHSRTFIEFSASTPERIRLRGGVTKFIHRNSLAGILPAKIACRRSKADFSYAFSHYDKALQSFLLHQSGHGLFDPVKLATMLERYHSGLVDEVSQWDVWGSFASAAFMVARAGLIERSDDDAFKLHR